MKKDTVIKKCEKFKELQRQIDELSYELDNIKEELKADMVERGVDEYVVGGFTISYKAVISNRFDSKAFKEKYGSLYENYSRESTSMRFQIK